MNLTRQNRAFVALVAALVLLPLEPLIAQSGGLAFLKLDTSAEALGAGSALTATSGDAFSTFINPAGLGGMKDNMAALTYTSWVADVQLFNVAGRFQSGKSGGIGVALTSSVSGDIEARDQPGASTSIFDAQFLAAGAGYGRQFGVVRVGVTAKYVLEKIFDYSSNGYAFDFGVQVDVVQNKLWLGGAVQNLGKMETLNLEQTDLPQTYRLGVTVQPVSIQMADDGSEPVRLYLSADVVHRTDEDKTVVQFGTWINALDFLFLRAGYLLDNELRAFTIGLGLAYESFRFDYAFLPFTEGFETSGQVITLQFNY